MSSSRAVLAWVLTAPCLLSMAAPQNDALEDWYYDRARGGPRVEEGQPNDRIERKCPSEIYNTNRLLCYTYEPNIEEEEAKLDPDSLPDDMERAFLETLDKQPSPYVLYRGNKNRLQQGPRQGGGINPNIVLYRSGARAQNSGGQRSQSGGQRSPQRGVGAQASGGNGKSNVALYRG